MTATSCDGTRPLTLLKLEMTEISTQPSSDLATSAIRNLSFG